MPAPSDLSVFANLPDIAEELKGPERKKVAALLEELGNLQAQTKLNDERSDEIKNILALTQAKHQLNGLRFGNLAFRVLQVPGRKTLDKLLLMENGVDPETIEASMKFGNPSMRREFKRLDIE
jgi:hypothetical protein